MDGLEMEHSSAASQAASHSAESRIESRDNAHGPDRSGVTQRDEHLPKVEQSLSADFARPEPGQTDARPEAGRAPAPDGGSQRSGSLEAKGDDSLARAATAPISQLDMAKELGRALDSAAAAKIREAEAFAEKMTHEAVSAVEKKALAVMDTVEKKAAEIGEAARQADRKIGSNPTVETLNEVLEKAIPAIAYPGLKETVEIVKHSASIMNAEWDVVFGDPAQQSDGKKELYNELREVYAQLYPVGIEAVSTFVAEKSQGVGTDEALRDAAEQGVKYAPFAQAEKHLENAYEAHERGDSHTAAVEAAKFVRDFVEEVVNIVEIIDGIRDLAGLRKRSPTVEKPGTGAPRGEVPKGEVRGNEAPKAGANGAKAPKTAAGGLAGGAAPAVDAARPRAPMIDVAEIKPVGGESGGWRQLGEPNRTGYAAIGSAAEKQGLMGVATYDRGTGEVRLTVREVNSYQREVYSQPIGRLSQAELDAMRQQSGGNPTRFGNLVENRVREMISEATGQQMYDPMKNPSKTGPDWLPQQLPLPHPSVPPPETRMRVDSSTVEPSTQPQHEYLDEKTTSSERPRLKRAVRPPR
ncbi:MULTISPECIES: hypothetical protein [unclassified Parafrankia]|uniref:hypothetical protein n=1 Tax=unclassified Parafrankia TaxID=2994368 RepID=UPI000DA4DB86|nr:MULTISPECIES: hypothetical protein [unclassified Parafrankia]TCJ34058.1 hypothetical protein E0504_34710 [Parafrankia sp. BMG5.11]SQD97783.1 hypothetical protein FMEAI12_4290018 [Parafrankia sp. Ea1.12]